MKIVLFTEDYVKGGQNAFIAELVNSWPKEDEFVIVSNQRNKGLDLIRFRCKRKISFVVHNLDLDYAIASYYSNKFNHIRKILMSYGRYLLLIYQIIKIFKLLSRISPDKIIISNGGYPGGQTCRAAAIASLFASRWGKPIMVCHNLAIPIRPWTLLFERLIDQLVMVSVRCLVGVSLSTCHSLSLRISVHYHKKICLIYNGINVDDGPSEPPLMRNGFNCPKYFRLLCIANFEKRKGHEFLLLSLKEILKSCPNSILYLAGTGSSDRILELKNLAMDLGVQRNVVYLGHVDDISSLVETIDILLIGSQEFESFGLTALEGMNKCKPVVSTDTGGLPEVVDDGVTGYVCPKSNHMMFASKVISLLTDQPLSMRFGMAGYYRLVDRFNSIRMAQDYHQLLTK